MFYSRVFVSPLQFLVSEPYVKSRLFCVGPSILNCHYTARYKVSFNTSCHCVILECSKILTQAHIQHSSLFVSHRLLSHVEQILILYVHFIFHFPILCFSDRKPCRIMVFIFKEEVFQLSIHYLYLSNIIYNIVRNYNSFKLLAPCSGIRGTHKPEQANIFINKRRSNKIKFYFTIKH